MSEPERKNCNNRLVSVALLEMLTQIACDYINPNGQAHHGVPPVSQAAAHRAIKEAGEILDANTKLARSRGSDVDQNQ
jgi:hypothetical protein